jgi:hypothetical protein
MTTLHWSRRTVAALFRRDEKQVRRWLSGASSPRPDDLAWLEDLAAYVAAHPPP